MANPTVMFFKGRDADVLTAAFKELSSKKLTQEKKPSVCKLLILNLPYLLFVYLFDKIGALHTARNGERQRGDMPERTTPPTGWNEG